MPRTKLLLVAGLPVLATLSLTACGRQTSHAEEGGAAAAGPTVVAAFYPLELVARSVAGGAVHVVALTPPGAEPHDLELTSEEISLLQQADLVLYLSGLQPAVDQALRGRSKPSLDVLALPGVDPLPVEGTARRGDGRPCRDPHVWLDPERFAVVARAIAAELGPASDAVPFLDRLAALDRELAAGLAHCERREIVTAHAAFGYLAARYDLRQVTLGGLSPEAEPSPRDLEALVAAARAAGARAVYSEPLISTAVAETLARELPARVLTLNPLEGLTPAEAARGEDYFSLMRANLASLRMGLECSE